MKVAQKGIHDILFAIEEVGESINVVVVVVVLKIMEMIAIAFS